MIDRISGIFCLSARLLLTLTLCCILESCFSSNKYVDNKVFQGLSDFVFVGNVHPQIKSDGGVDLYEIPIHRSDESERPAKLECNLLYVFHHVAYVDSGDLATNIIPPRLSKLGYKIIETTPLAFATTGGPFFSIKFTDGKHIGLIFNRTDTTVSDPRYMKQDYVIFFEK